MRAASVLVAAAALVLAAPALADDPLVLETKISLPDVDGRIDHMAIDLAHQRLFVAELGNDSVGVVDLAHRKVIRTLDHMKEPQGVAYEANTETLYVSSGLDGAVRLFVGMALKPGDVIPLGRDADNMRIDAKSGLVFVGHSTGAIAVIDPVSRKKQGDIPLREHPEGFALAPAGDRIFVNVPDLRQIAVLDRAAGKQVASWPTGGGHGNFAMAFDGGSGRVLTVYRRPPRLDALSPADGKVVASISTCGDADDVFVDQRRNRVYVSCGDGVVDVFQRQGEGYERLARVPTASGARTSLFSDALDRLYVAARTAGGAPAALWVFRPTP
jgi:DNA-binding beta-propeller fold protein YncE